MIKRDALDRDDCGDLRLEEYQSANGESQSFLWSKLQSKQP
jgi:hypothetical protein